MHKEIVPFHDRYMEDAARLLALRHQRDRLREPALPARFSDPVNAHCAIEKIWQKPHASGVVALQAEHVIGYLIGTPQIDTSRGRTVWIPLAGHALDLAQNAELYRDLYAALSPQWLKSGCFAHYILIPATDQAALAAWFALSFGKEQAHGIRETATSDLAAMPIDPAIQIRRAGPDDLEAVLACSNELKRYLASPPIYAPLLPEYEDEMRQMFTEILSDSTAIYWMAHKHKRFLGYQLYTLAPGEVADDDLLKPELHYTYLSISVTFEEARGQGIGQALTAHGLRWAQAQGDTLCGIDWRVANLSASRFWPRQGFRTIAYRLYRSVDERVSWGHEQA